MAYKYNKTIMNGSERLIDGIKNIEMFLDDNDDWNFHDSEIVGFEWKRQERIFTVSVEPLGYEPSIEIPMGKRLILDFKFIGVFDIHMDYNVPEYIYEIEMDIIKNDFLECWFNGCSIRVTSKKLRVDKPRFIDKIEFQ